MFFHSGWPSEGTVFTLGIQPATGSFAGVFDTA
jgi:hypothetical protein